MLTDSGDFPVAEQTQSSAQVDFATRVRNRALRLAFRNCVDKLSPESDRSVIPARLARSGRARKIPLSWGQPRIALRLIGDDPCFHWCALITDIVLCRTHSDLGTP